MQNKNIGQNIARLRKEKNMTQFQLGELLNVTDKAVSKWERNLSYPDIDTLPRLADALGVQVEDLLGFKLGENENTEAFNAGFTRVIPVVFKAIPLAMGGAVVVLSTLRELEASSGFIMLGIGMFFLALDRLKSN